MKLADFKPFPTRSSFPAPTFWPAYVAIVEPSASNGQQLKPEIRPAAVTAATAWEPSEFTAVCKITLPIAVMEYCRPIGMPMLQSMIAWRPSNFISSFSNLRISYCFLIYKKHKIPEISWERTVAHAAPATPICRTRIASRSKRIFNMAEITRNITGVRLSPRERIIPDSKL